MAENAEVLQYTEPIQSKIVQALNESGIDRWPYFHFRSQSEQTEFDRAA